MISGYISESKDRSPLTKKGDTGILIHEKAEFMNSLPLAYFTHLEDNSGFMAAGIGDAPKICSREWEAEKYKYFEASRPGIISYSRDGSRWEKVGGLKHAEGAFSGLFLCTRKGTLIYIYSDFSEAVFNWDKNKHDALDAALPVYASRSTDKAKTWEPVKKLHDHYTGECMDIIQTKSGRVVFTTMKFLNGPGRHSVMTYGSDDEGQTWQASNIIDLGGVGNHGGISEASMVELNDGRLLKYIRTNWEQFWIAISEDEGRYWHPYGPSGVDASSAPGALKRLSSGRIVLVWNRWYPEGKKEVELKGGDCNWSETPVSNFREELSMSFSEDECRSWSAPVVVARNPGGQISYSSVFEPEPGTIWIISKWTVYKDAKYFREDASLKIKIEESDFI